MNDRNLNGTPAGLRRIEARLDALGAHEASTAPAGLEERLLSGVRAGLAPAAEPIAVIRRVRIVTRMRVAAALAVAGGLAAIMGARMTGAPAARAASAVGERVVASGSISARLEDDVELWLSLKTPDSLQSVSDSIDMLSVDTTLLRGTALDSDLGTLPDPGTM
jgi:hypothetical protein